MDYQNHGRKIDKRKKNTGTEKKDEQTEYEEALDKVVDLMQELTVQLNDCFSAIEEANSQAERVKAETEFHEAMTSKSEQFHACFNEARSRQSHLNIPVAVNAEGTEVQIEEIPNMNSGRKFPIQAQVWVYILIGRLLHPIGEFDDWQVIPLFLGKAGTGKSLIANTVKKMFGKQDVGTLSSNSEAKFGLEALENKLIWVISEIKRNLALDVADFQSMVSGEEVSVARKNKVASIVKWRAPGLLCGNERPGWIDSQGSIARRLVIFNFQQTVKSHDVDCELEKKLQQELSALILKCNMAYRHTTEFNKGKGGIWNLLPDYFHHQRRTLQISNDPVAAAIYNENVFELWANRVDNSDDMNDWYVSLTSIQYEYTVKWKEVRGGTPEPFCVEKYGSVFDEAGLYTVEDNRVDPESTNMESRLAVWVAGIRKKVSGAN